MIYGGPLVRRGEILIWESRQTFVLGTWTWAARCGCPIPVGGPRGCRICSRRRKYQVPVWRRMICCCGRCSIFPKAHSRGAKALLGERTHGSLRMYRMVHRGEANLLLTLQSELDFSIRSSYVMSTNSVLRPHWPPCKVLHKIPNLLLYMQMKVKQVARKPSVLCFCKQRRSSYALAPTM